MTSLIFSRQVGSLSGGSAVYESLLRVGKQKKLCTACNRHLSDQELVVFEKYVRPLELPPRSTQLVPDERPDAEGIS